MRGRMDVAARSGRLRRGEARRPVRRALRELAGRYPRGERGGDHAHRPLRSVRRVWFLSVLRSLGRDYPAGRATTSLSCPDMAPQTSPWRPSISRTFAFGDGCARTTKVSVAGSKRASPFAPQSVTHTMSASSTNTAYAIGLVPGSFHSFHDVLS